MDNTSEAPQLTQSDIADMEAGEGQEYLVMTDAFGWGRQKTARGAYRLAKAHSSYNVSKAMLYLVPEGAFVDQMGYIRWERAPEKSVTDAVDQGIEVIGELKMAKKR